MRIQLEAINRHGVTMRGSWGAPTAFKHDPNGYGDDGAGHIDELPPELASALLTHWGFTVTEAGAN